MWSAKLILWITNIVIGFIEFIIGLRIFLKLVGASAVAPFVQWVYTTSQPLLRPFAGMLPTASLSSSPPQIVIEFSALFAFLVYAFIGYLIGELLAYFTYQRTRYYSDEEEVIEKPGRKNRRILA